MPGWTRAQRCQGSVSKHYEEGRWTALINSLSHLILSSTFYDKVYWKSCQAKWTFLLLWQ